jgi:hypothetical protein
MKKFYTFCDFNVICKVQAAIDHITTQDKEGSFLSIMRGHTPGWYAKCYAVHILAI